MIRTVLAWRHQHKIFFSIVITLMIPVMYNFVIAQHPTQFALHHKPVLLYVAVFVSLGMVRGIYQHVATCISIAATLPLMGLRACFERAVSAQARNGVPSKMPLVAVGGPSQRRRFTATTLTNAGGYLIQTWYVTARATALLMMLRQVSRWMVFVVWLGLYGLSTPTGTKLNVHSPIIT